MVEIRVLEHVIEISGKQISTNKWLLYQDWQEVYNILHTAAESHMKSELPGTVVAEGKDTKVA
jgi:hypothetical protein